MPRARFAFVVLACAGGVGATACGPDLPERMWRSEHVHYFSRAGDDSVCPAVLDELEAHAAVIADLFHIEPTPVTYYKFGGIDDYDRNADCAAGADTCASNATVRSADSFDRHALIHAYLAPYGRPPPLLAEGAAVALSCTRTPRPTGSWRDAYTADRLSPQLAGAGGWLAGYLMRMFRATWLVNFYGSVEINATPDEFAQVFADIYGMTLDEVWAAAISVPQAPLRCPWECGARPAVPTDGAVHPLTPVCGAGALQLSLDLPAGSVTRWRIDGAGRFAVRSCDGNDEPHTGLDGQDGPGVLLAPLGAGKYFVDAAVQKGATSTLTVDSAALPALTSIACASAAVVPDDLTELKTLALFYPSSEGAQFTRFAAGTDRGGQLSMYTDAPPATGSLCADCSGPQACAIAHVTLNTAWMPAGTVLNVPPGAAATALFTWR
jgi:hypothetical protein